MSRNIAASVRARLLNRAKALGEEFQFTLIRYACERFLYRIGVSAVHDRCVLKGGSLLAVWLEEPYRATRDIDMLAAGGADEAAVRSIVETVCDVPCLDDGLTFNKASLRIAPIRAFQAYPGQQARLNAHLDNALIPLQVDSASAMRFRRIWKWRKYPPCSGIYLRHRCASTRAPRPLPRSLRRWCSWSTATPA